MFLYLLVLIAAAFESRKIKKLLKRLDLLKMAQRLLLTRAEVFYLL